MKVTAEVRINFDQQANSLFTEREFDDQIYDELTIKFAQELRKMNPLRFKAYEDNNYCYQVQGIVLSMKTFRQFMEFLQNELPIDKFNEIRNTLNNTI